ncbi:MAG: DUF2147 domain-containing protein [Gammaproteobacteria bacterium]
MKTVLSLNKWLIKRIIFLILLPFCTPIFAAQNAIEGDWIVPDESSHQPISIVRITQQGKTLTGQVVKLFDDTHAVCTECTGNLKNKPIIGMTVLWGFHPEGEKWTGGKVLAAKKGKIYNAELTPQGQTLILGVRVFGSVHTETWIRSSQ